MTDALSTEDRENLADFADFYREEIAAELGLVRQDEGLFSAEDAKLLDAEILKRFLMRREEDRLMNLADLLYWEGNEIMEKLGMKQDENFQWSEADRTWVWNMAVEHGMQWLHDEAARRSCL